MTYYEVLEIPENATQEEIVDAFRRAAKKYHPDLNHSDNAKDLFVYAYEAYDILKDQKKRSFYDASLRINMAYAEKQSHAEKNNDESQNKTTAEDQQEFHRNRAKAREKGEEYARKKYQSFTDEFWGTVKRIAKGTVDVAEGVAVGAAKGCLIGLCKAGIIAIIMLIIIGIVTCQTSVEKNNREDQFAGIFSQLNSELYFKAYPYQNEAYDFEGKKVLIVDMNRRDIYRRFWYINESHQAKEDVEIDFLIQVNLNNIVVGQYTDGASALRNDYTLRVVDYHKKTTIDIISAQGNEPPKTKNVHGDVGGGNDLDSKLLPKWFGSQSN